MEDCATLCSPLIPWNIGGAFVSTTIGVPTILYTPFAFACWLAPLFGLILALFGKFIPRVDDALVTQPEIKSQENVSPIPDILVL
ncbi:Na(+)/H(+) antiporter NhaC [compost metagenome]